MLVVERRATLDESAPRSTEICSWHALAEGLEGRVDATESPDQVACRAIDVVHAAGVAQADEVVAVSVLVDRVEVAAVHARQRAARSSQYEVRRTSQRRSRISCQRRRRASCTSGSQERGRAMPRKT